MKVHELISILERMPRDSDVWHLWDGAARTEIVHVWLTADGRVITADEREPCYDAKDRPPWAQDTRDWSTPPVS